MPKAYWCCLITSFWRLIESVTRSDFCKSAVSLSLCWKTRKMIQMHHIRVKSSLQEYSYFCTHAFFQMVCYNLTIFQYQFFINTYSCRKNLNQLCTMYYCTMRPKIMKSCKISWYYLLYRYVIFHEFKKFLKKHPHPNKLSYETLTYIICITTYYGNMGCWVFMWGYNIRNFFA